MIETEPRQENQASDRYAGQDMRQRFMMDGAFLGSVALVCLLVALILTQLSSASRAQGGHDHRDGDNRDGIAQTAKVRHTRSPPTRG